MSEESKKIVVIGGGLAGVSAAHTLTQRGYAVTIIERNNRLGGRVHTHVVDGAAVEMGACFLTRDYTNLLAFIRDNGLGQYLYRQQGSTGTFKNGQVYMVTPRVLLANTPLSWRAKLQVFPLLLKTLANWRQLDTHAFWKASDLDTCSVADVFSSAGGKEFMEKVLQSALNGYFYWTPEHTSQAMMYILCRTAFKQGTFNVQGGLKQIVDRAAKGSNVLLGHSVSGVKQTASGNYAVTIEQDDKRRTLQADGVICATTASAVPALFTHLTDTQKDFFKAVEYSSGALISRTYKAEDTKGDKAIAFPRHEGVELSSVTLSPEPKAGKATYATVKAYASGDAAAEIAALPDSQLTSRLIADMAPVKDTVLVGDPAPVATYIQRWAEALPFYDVGHFKRLRQFKDGAIEDPSLPIAFAGDYLDGPFMEGAFTSGAEAANRLHNRLHDK